jgi:hypothetical protein
MLGRLVMQAGLHATDVEAGDEADQRDCMPHSACHEGLCRTLWCHQVVMFKLWDAPC